MLKQMERDSGSIFVSECHLSHLLQLNLALATLVRKSRVQE